MAAKYYRDPAIRKLLEVKAEAISLGLPESIITGLQSVEDLHMGVTVRGGSERHITIKEMFLIFPL
jgi:hypothetical protein